MESRVQSWNTDFNGTLRSAVLSTIPVVDLARATSTTSRRSDALIDTAGPHHVSRSGHGMFVLWTTSAVDWLYRDSERVQRAWEDAKAGRFYFHGQVGHPLGVPDFAYAGEVPPWHRVGRPNRRAVGPEG